MLSNINVPATAGTLGIIFISFESITELNKSEFSCSSASIQFYECNSQINTITIFVFKNKLKKHGMHLLAFFTE